VQRAHPCPRVVIRWRKEQEPFGKNQNEVVATRVTKSAPSDAVLAIPSGKAGPEKEDSTICILTNVICVCQVFRQENPAHGLSAPETGQKGRCFGATAVLVARSRMICWRSRAITLHAFVTCSRTLDTVFVGEMGNGLRQRNR